MKKRGPGPRKGPGIAVGYVRVSTETQAEQGVSLADQEAKIRAWAEARGLEVMAVHTDALSGARADRPGLEAALAATCESGGVLVVASLSRLGRSLAGILAVAERLRDRGADFASIAEEFNTATPGGRLVYRIFGVLGEFEREQIADRITSALRHLKAQGKRTGGVPFGFDLHADQETLVPNRSEERAIALMIEMKAAGATLRAIAEELQRRRIKTKKGRTAWAPKVVADVLRRSQDDKAA